MDRISPGRLTRVATPFRLRRVVRQPPLDDTRDASRGVSIVHLPQLRTQLTDGRILS